MPTERCEAIVLHSAPYGEHGLLIETYTLEQGAKTFLTTGAKNSKTGIRYAPYAHPLALVQIGYRHKRGDEGLYLLTGIERTTPPGLLLTDMRRSTTALFLASMLRRLLGQQFENSELYDYCHQGVRLLASPDAPLALFPQAFLLGLCHQLGIQPQGEHSPATPLFDLENGVFTTARYEVSDSNPYSNRDTASHLYALMQGGYETPPSTIPRPQRANLLRLLMHYLEIHMGIHLPSDALEVLESIWE